ncbi:lysoplasmalogenase TMEM86B isoform X1 [Carettochelys insculpta]|uniref:lysoplasmalogenase TMEM86B isoform X1 n=1 Tax=Carettochelys insculpta TaxID=44489 RepID=UPI003EBAFA1C
MAMATWETLRATSRFLTLLPFLVSCVLYFALWLQEPSWLSTCVKTLPVLSLSFFLWAQGLKEGAWTPLAYWVCQGLLCSSVGDACLVWPQLFPLGMAAFALAHTCYLWALGLRPLLPLLALALALVWVGGYRLLSPCLKGPSVPAVGGYGALLVAVAWRALAHPAPHLALAAGSLFFIASDLVLALDHFCAPVPHVHLLVMATYYTAQFLIAVGASLATPHHKES